MAYTLYFVLRTVQSIKTGQTKMKGLVWKARWSQWVRHKGKVEADSLSNLPQLLHQGQATQQEHAAERWPCPGCTNRAAHCARLATLNQWKKTWNQGHPLLFLPPPQLFLSETKECSKSKKEAQPGSTADFEEKILEVFGKRCDKDELWCLFGVWMQNSNIYLMNRRAFSTFV